MIGALVPQVMSAFGVETVVPLACENRQLCRMPLPWTVKPPHSGSAWPAGRQKKKNNNKAACRMATQSGWSRAGGLPSGKPHGAATGSGGIRGGNDRTCIWQVAR